MEGLQVGLHPGAAARVRPRDGQRHSHRVTSLANAAGRAMLRGTPAAHGGGTRIASNLQTTVRDLQRRKARGRRGLAVLEGVRLVEEALAAGLEVKGALVSPDLARTTRGQAVVAELAGHAVAVEEGGARTFGPLAGSETPQGVLAVGAPRGWTAPAGSPPPRR